MGEVLARLQRVQNALVRVVCTAQQRAPKASLRKSLHLLLIRQRITYKIVTLTFNLRVHEQPVYLADHIIEHTPSRILRSSRKRFTRCPAVQDAIATRAMGVAAPRTWNDLSVHIRSTKQFSETNKITSVWHRIPLTTVIISAPLTRCLDKRLTL